MNYQTRIQELRQALKTNDIDAFVTMADVNYFYLSGFSGSSGALIVTMDEAILITDGRYITQSKEQTNESGVEVIIHTQPLLTEITDVLKKLEAKKVGYEASRLLVSQLFALESDKYELMPVTGVVERLREIKDGQERTAIQQAIDVIEETYANMLTYAKAGMTEVDIAMRMEMNMRQLGASGPSFDTIIASGLRGALPHGQASSKIIEDGELVTVDFGALVNGYCSDMTRTFAVGTPSEKMIEIYNTVLQAQIAGTEAIAPGKTGAEVDAAARKVIEDAGYGEYFSHSLGHAVGIEVHEMPGLSKVSDRILEPGMIVTTEPGIYIEGIGGVRIEDMVLVTENGHSNLMTLPKELVIV